MEPPVVNFRMRKAWNELWNFSSQELSLPGTNIPYVKLSLPEAKMPWNFRIRSENDVELSLPGENVTPPVSKNVTLAFSYKNKI